jgi:hypothetical protein
MLDPFTPEAGLALELETVIPLEIVRLQRVDCLSHLFGNPFIGIEFQYPVIGCQFHGVALLVPETAEPVLEEGHAAFVTDVRSGIGAEIIDNNNFVSPVQ